MPIAKLFQRVLILTVCALLELGSARAGELQARKSRAYNTRASEGQFDLRLVVDGEVDIYVQGRRVWEETLRGRPPQDAGSEFTQPLPSADLEVFEIEKKDGRGDVRLLEEPTVQNRYTAWIRLHDNRGGHDRYHIRLRWKTARILGGRQPRRAGGGRLPARQIAWQGPAATQGLFDLKVEVDGAVDFFISGDRIRYEVIEGREPRDAGSTYTVPLPRARLSDFFWRKQRGRGQVELFEEPWAGNNHTARLRIEDLSRGPSYYHVQFGWQAGPGSRQAGRQALATRLRGRRAASGLPGRLLDSSKEQPRRYDGSRSGRFSFQGRIDHQVVFYVRGDQVSAEIWQGRYPEVERFYFSQPLPVSLLRDIEIRHKDGRGQVELLEEPDAYNGYRAAIRVVDDKRGDDWYHFELRWRR